MKLITLVSVLAGIFTPASASSLRGDFESDVAAASAPSDIDGRNLQNCVARSTYLGCYENRNKDRALPYQVDGKSHTAVTCEATCAGLGFSFFAREWKGQCFCGNDATYMKHGEDDGCDCCGDNVGGGKMCVYMLNAEDPAPGCAVGAPNKPYLGCFEDKNRNRAMPYRVDGRTHTAIECMAACSDMGMAYFGREWRGQCFCSDDATYMKHGSESNCDCCGGNVGGGKLCVWSS